MSDSKAIYFDDLKNVAVENLLSILSKNTNNKGITKKNLDFWCWKHVNNPFGESVGIVAKCEGSDDLVSIRPFMMWQLTSEGNINFNAVRPVDTVTIPSWRGKGLFTRLTLSSIEKLPENTLIFNTPNNNSLSGYLKMGWEIVADFNVFIKVGSLNSIVASQVSRLFERDINKRFTLRSEAISSENLTETEKDNILDFIVSAESNRIVTGIRTLKDYSYFRWRYFKQPNVKYRFYRKYNNGQLNGIVILREEERRGFIGAVIVEIYTTVYNLDSQVSLLKKFFKEVKYCFFVAHFSPTSVEALSLKKFLFFRKKNMKLVARWSNINCPYVLSDFKWDFTFGELEIF